MSGQTQTRSMNDRMVARRWREARLLDVRPLVAGVREIILDVPSWPGHLAGQHVDVRTFGTGAWSHVRSFSIANPPAVTPDSATRVHLAVQEFDHGGLSRSFSAPGATSRLQVDGPRGDRMTWLPAEMGSRPLLLIGGGTGIVPLLAIAGAWEATLPHSRLKVLYSVRSLEMRLFADDLARLAEYDHAEVATIVTGDGPAPLRHRRGAGRLSALDLELFGWPAEAMPECFVCGPTPFVESVTRMLVQTKHPAARVHTEWLVPTGAE